MPVYGCPNGKYRIGTGPCVYANRASAERAYAAYRAQKNIFDIEKQTWRSIRYRLGQLVDYFVQKTWFITTYESGGAWEEVAVEFEPDPEERLPRKFVYIWMTEGDDRVCPICEPLHGQEFSQAQMNSLEFPAHHTCRCWIDTKAIM